MNGQKEKTRAAPHKSEEEVRPLEQLGNRRIRGILWKTKTTR